jgi:hypothetical protein
VNTGNKTGNRGQDGRDGGGSMNSTTLHTANHSAAKNWHSSDMADEHTNDKGDDAYDVDNDNASRGTNNQHSESD